MPEHQQEADMATEHDVIIIGAGLSGLTAAHFLKKLQPQSSYRILEKDARPGGAIMSLHEEDFLAEWGPHGFLNNTPESIEPVIHDLLINVFLLWFY